MKNGEETKLAKLKSTKDLKTLSQVRLKTDTDV